MSDLQRYQKFVSLMQDKFPKLTVAFKDESKLMKVIAKILFFNKPFMTSFITTIGNTVYFPSRSWLEEDPVRAMMVLSHECVHIRDSAKYTSAIFSMGYLAPQLLALLALPAFFLIHWWALLLLVCLAPLPSPGRMFFEKRGYSMSLFILHQRYQELGITDQQQMLSLLNASAQNIDTKNFRGSAYYFMWPFGMMPAFHQIINEIMTGDILEKDEIYPVVKLAFGASGQSQV